jgi:hypothetical protein
LLLRFALLSLTGVRADSVVGNYDSISSGATIVKSDTQCTYSSKYRLVPYDGISNQGTPQVLYNGEWCTIYQGWFSMETAQLFCQEIGMGDAVSTYLSYTNYIDP